VVIIIVVRETRCFSTAAELFVHTLLQLFRSNATFGIQTPMHLNQMAERFCLNRILSIHSALLINIFRLSREPLIRIGLCETAGSFKPSRMIRFANNT